jgi:hypothetical protein
MKMKILSGLFIILFLTGCFNAGAFLSGNQTQIKLAGNNYEIIAKNVSGEARAGYILGLSWSLGLAAETLALVRVTGSGLLYKEALEDLWSNYERDHGSIEGKKLALVNVRYDGDCLNLILYTESRISIRADIIEFK